MKKILFMALLLLCTPLLYSQSSIQQVAITTDGTALTSATRTAVDSSSVLSNWGSQGLLAVVNVSDTTINRAVIVRIQGYNPATGAFYNILSSDTLKRSTTPVLLRVHPSLTASSNLIAKDILPKRWRIYVDIYYSGTATYSVGYSTLP